MVLLSDATLRNQAGPKLIASPILARTPFGRLLALLAAVNGSALSGCLSTNGSPGRLSCYNHSSVGCSGRRWVAVTIQFPGSMIPLLRQLLLLLDEEADDFVQLFLIEIK